jgi:hypothetical protein
MPYRYPGVKKHKNQQYVKEHLKYFSSKNLKTFSKYIALDLPTGGCNSTWTHRWALRAAQSPIYYQ